MNILLYKKQLSTIIEQVNTDKGFGTSIDNTRVVKNYKPIDFEKTNEKKLPYQNFQNADHDVMISILNGLGGLINPETLGFLYAWRQAESSLGAEERYFCNNPFSTTWDSDQTKMKLGSPESTMYSRTNSHGVKSYKEIETGISSTIKTIKKYPKILKGLTTPGLNCLQISQIASSDLDKWGSGGSHVKSICKKYLNGSTPAPRPINRGKGCY